MNRRMSGSDASLNAPLRSDGESEWQDWLADDDAEPARRIGRKRRVRCAAWRCCKGDGRSERARAHIITGAALVDEPKTLEELSQVYGVSRERIRQIEVRAFEKLQTEMVRLAQERGLAPA
jgi:RNA polymerase sigma-32 factor